MSYRRTLHRLLIAGIGSILCGGCAGASAPARAAVTTQPSPAAATQPILTSLRQAPDAGAPASSPPTLLQQFDVNLDRLSRGQPPLGSEPGARSEEQNLVSAVIAAMSDFRSTLSDESGLLSTKTAPILKLSDQIQQQIPLTLPVVALCRSVQQFGVYDPIDPARFPAGVESQAIVYCQVEHFRSQVSSGTGDWETKLNYDATLYSDTDHPIAVISKKPANITDHCRQRRRDFFLADRMSFPASLPAGKYLLKVTVIDQSANHVAEKTIPVVIAPRD